MIYYVIAMFAVGVFLSGFFSGSETGFYRASRVRFVMDGLDGDRISRTMLWLFNNPTMFVATTLTGNNVANYLVSLATVLAANILFASAVTTAEIIAPIAVAPALFVYGELLPKNVYFMAPDRMLRRSAPLILFFTVLFAPVAAVLWSLARLLEKMLGQSPEKIRFVLARRELQNVLQEGQEAGILHPSQRLLSQTFFLEASRTVQHFCTPMTRVHALPLGTTAGRALRFARRYRLSEVPFYQTSRSHLVGYVRTVDLLMQSNQNQPIRETHPFEKLPYSELFGEALLRMQTNRETLAIVVGEQEKPVGLLSIDQLTDPLLKGPLGSLRR